MRIPWTYACDDLSIDRGGRRVIHDVTTEFYAGEITAIVGPNGAGKSSLLMAFAGLLPPASGEMWFDAGPLSTMPPRMRARLIGYLPQDGAIAWDVAVETLVALGRIPHGDDKLEPVDAAIRTMDLEALRHRPVSELSGGEKSRVLFARVLATDPIFILADEPLAALDLAHQLALIEKLKECAADEQGVVMVLHDLAMAMNHADRVLVLSEGRLVADGPPLEALTAETIAQVWGTDVEWIGEAGRQAIVASVRD